MGLGTPAELFDGLLADLKHGSLSGPSVGFLAFSVILAVFLSLWLFKDRKAPPVVSTIPVIGGLLKFMKGPMVLVQDLYPKYGSVFTLPLFHMRITFLVGPEVSSHFYKAPEEQMSQQEVYRFNVPTFGPGVVFDVPYSIRMEQFRFFADALKASRIRTYVEMMVQEAQDYFGAWKEEGEVDLKEELAQLIILTASRCLLGKEVREQIVGNIVQLFHDLDEGMQPISVAFPYLPIAAHRKRDRARAELARIFKKIIDTRKAQGTKEEDMLQVFIDSKYRSSGRSTTADEVTGFLIAALFGGQHTSSLTAAWLGIYLMTQGKAWTAGLVREQQEVMARHGAKLDYDILNEMDCLHRFLKETLRLHPPLVMLLRQSHSAFRLLSRACPPACPHALSCPASVPSIVSELREDSVLVWHSPLVYADVSRKKGDDTEPLPCPLACPLVSC